jgi:hypothetical protein
MGVCGQPREKLGIPTPIREPDEANPETRTMMFRKTCSKCARQATVELNNVALCTEHAADAVLEHQGKVPMPRPLR